jgi:hypothetical protein
VTSRRFLTNLFCIVLAVAAVLVVVNVRIDLYGLFRSNHGRDLKVYGEERNCKYLFSYRYLPENFDALMLGSSVSDNIPVRTLAGLRTYNASLNGGVMAEARNLGTNALRRGHFKLVALSIHRYMMQTAGEKTNFMIPQRYWGAFGSMQLYSATFAYFLDREHIRSSAFDSNGAQSYGPATATTHAKVDRDAADYRKGASGRWQFRIDPQAYRDLQELVRVVHERHAVLLAFTPPMPTVMQEATSKELAAFDALLHPAFSAGDVFVDFNQPKYHYISDDYGNFREAAHLSDTGARIFANALDGLASEVIASRAPVVGTLANIERR